MSRVTDCPSTGTSVAQSIKKSSDEAFISEYLVAIGSDSTAVNTGRKIGAISTLEKLIGHSMHWFICHLHLLELPLQCLCNALIGATDGPGSFKCKLNKSI